MTFKASFRIPSKTPHAWFYYSVVYIFLAATEGITFAQTHNKANIFAVSANLLAYLFLILTCIQIVANFIHLLKERPKFNFKKVIFIIGLLMVDYILLIAEYVLVHLFTQ